MASSCFGRLRLGGVLALLALTACAQERPSEATAAVEEAIAQAVAPGFQEELFVSGRTEPTAVRFAPDGRVFVAEKSGLLWAYQSVENPGAPVRVVDLRASVHNFWDRGLLGVAVHPDFPAVPHVYVVYTHDAFADGTGPRWGTGGPNPSTADNCPSPPGGTDDGCVVYGRLSRIVIDPTTLIGTEQPLLSGNWCQQYPSHSVGDLAFGEDGYLYLTAGDGASFNFADFGQDGSPVNPCGDPPGGSMTGVNAEGGALRSQDLMTSGDATTLDGALLRLDVSGATPVAPADNPLVGNAVADDDFIVAMGLRNPYRMTRRPGTNELWIADVGWNAWEEINRVDVPTGSIENFGWPCYEGNGQQSGYASRTLCQNLYAGSVPANMVVRAPYYAYSHAEQVVAGDGCGTGGSSITGIAFNTSTTYPAAYQGALFFADSTRQCVWTMFADASGNPNPASRQTFVTKSSGRVVDLSMGPDGKLYYVDFDGGNVYRVAFYPENTPPAPVIAADPTSGPAPLAVAFDASGSSDVEDGTTLSFEWDLDGDNAFDDATGATASHTYAQPGSYLASVRVTDSGGLSRTASVTIVADNTPPVPVIDAPLSSQLWSANELIPFSGHALDAEEGLLPPERLSWNVILHHCSTPEDCHPHSVTGISGVASGTFQAPDHEYPAYIEIKLTATDSASGFWWDGAWRHRLPITLSGTLPAGELLDVPVLVSLDASRIAYADVLPNGADLRFVDETENLLSHEIESWNPGGTSVIWLKLPRVESASAGKRIHLYYGNPNASDAQAPAAVWSNGYAAVWHLGSTLSDSSGNGNTGTVLGAVPTTGRLGGAYQFDGVSAHLDMGAGSSLALSSAASIEAWVRVADPAEDNYGRIVCKKTTWDATSGYDLEYNPGLNYFSSLGSGADYLRAGSVDLDTNWHYLASSASGTTGRLYVDGLDRTTDGTLTRIVSSAQPLHIGRRSGGGDYFRGAIDEVRISSVARPAAWIALQNTSMRDALFTYGAVEQPSTLSATTSVIIQPRTVNLEFQSVPPGLELTVGSESRTTPFVETLIQGSVTSVTAPLSQTLSNVGYEFGSWSDGAAAAHDIVADQSLSPLVATYTAAPSCTDGTQNGGESGVDCGGPCPPCPACEPGDCEDANLCTSDACDPEAGCTNTPVTCNDENACTTDGCDPTTGCSNTPVTCNDENACTTDACNPATGCANTPVTCDDGNPCTTDSCSPSIGCVYQANTAPCSDDGNACTNDVCSAGVCTHPDNGTCGNQPFQESGGTVVIEAEHFHTNLARANDSWNLVNDASASGGQVLQAAPDNGTAIVSNYTTTSPELRFQIAFATPGTYHVWLRGRGPNGDGDSCHAGINGTGPASADKISSFSTGFGWSRSTMDGPTATITVASAGIHTFNVWMREDGFVLDKIVLTTNGSFTPSGAGPAESPRTGSGCTSAAQCNDGNPCTADACVSGACQNAPVTNGTACADDGNTCTNDVCTNGACTHPNNTAPCADDGSTCTNDVCSGGVCTHPQNGSCGSSPCAAYCSSPTTFSSTSYQSGNLGTQSTCHQTTANLNGGVCGNFATGRTLSVNGQLMSCNAGNWSALPAKVNGGYCITTTAGNHAWAYFATW
jgi:glucose/arabinose dehydrogenase